MTTSSPAPNGPPDIVLVVTDQQRRDQVSWAGDGCFETPALDGLRAQGVVFDTAYSGSTTCVPARMSFLTGVLHHRLPTQVNGLALREGHWTVAHALRREGYATALVGKMHFEPVYADHGFDTMRMCEDLFPSGGYAAGTADDYAATLAERGIPDWRPELRDRAPDEPPAPVGLLGTFPYDEELHPTGWVRDQAIEVLRARDRRRPLFLVISFPSPHPPYNPPEPWASRYDPEEIEVPTDGFEVNEALPPGFRRALDAGPQRVGTARQTKRILTAVRALVRQLDDAIAAVLTEIDLQRTSIFFTSDHGDYAGHRGLLMKRPWIPFDDLARVPFLAAGTGVVGARRLDGLVSTLDLAPTFLDLAGVEVPPGLDGVSQASVLGDAGAIADRDRTVRCATSQHWPMVRRGPLKFISDRWTHEHVVFEMEGDPGETVNRANDVTLGEAGVALMESMAGFSDEPSTLTADGPIG